MGQSPWFKKSRAGIYIPTPTREVFASVKLGIKGHFKIELLDAKTQKVKRCVEFDNTITDAGLNALGGVSSLSTLTNWCGVGTGSNTPAFSDTALQAQVGSRVSSNGGFADSIVAGPSFEYWEATRVRLFTESEGNGNLTEIGFFSSNVGGTLWTRQLFLSGGLPTTIVKTNQDQLRVTYSWRIYPPIVTNTQNIDINILGVPTATVVNTRAIQISSPAWQEAPMGFGSSPASSNNSRFWETNVLPPTTGFFTGSSASATTITWQAYVLNNFYRDLEFRLDPPSGNFATGIGGVEWYGLNSLSASGIATVFNPKIPKNNTQRVIVMFRLGWGRA